MIKRSNCRTAPSLSLIALLILFMALYSCNRSQEVDRVASTSTTVDAYRVVPEDFTIEVKATGELLPLEQTEIRAAVGGHVTQIHFREGEVVSEGALLAELDSRRWEAQQRGLRSRLEASSAELDRKLSLFKMDGVSEAEVEQTRAEVAVLQSQIDELDVLIDLSRIRAPYSGTLGMRDFSLGAYLREGDLITHIVQTEKLRVGFSIPARYHHQLSKGQSVAVTSSSGGHEAKATVYAVNPLISSTSRSIEVRAYLDNSGHNFTAGDFVTVVLPKEQNNDALLIPAEAIIPELNRQVVFIAQDGNAVRREVVTGARTAGRIQILKGVYPGELVITTGLMVLRDGAKVTVQNSNREATQ